jgi:hypothetical protein
MRTLGCVVLLVVLSAGSAGAQALQRLAVRDFNLSADAARLQVGGTLRLTMRVHVDQPVDQLDNVTLPNVSGFDILGDERQCATAGRGTDCSETLQMSPNAAGTYTIGPVTLDSIDPRTNRPTHFATNVVTVTVTPAAGGAGPIEVPSLLYDVMRQILILAIAAIIVLVLIWGLGLSRRRGPAPAYLPEAPPVRLRHRLRRRPIPTRHCGRRSPRSRSSRRGRASSRCATCSAPGPAPAPTRRSRP